MNSATVSLATETVARLASALAKVKGAAFASFVYTAKGTGETARHTVILGSTYKNTVQKSMEELTRKLPTLSGIDLEAANNVLVSLGKSLLACDTGIAHPDNTRAGTYENVLPDLRILDNGDLEITALAHRKVVIVPGVYKTVKSSPIVAAQNALKKDLPISKRRSFSITPENFHSIRIGGEEIAND
jgi:hypothetical protein